MTLIICSLCWGNPWMSILYNFSLYLELNLNAVCWSFSMTSLTFVVFRHDWMCSQKTSVSNRVSSFSIVYIPGQKRDKLTQLGMHGIISMHHISLCLFLFFRLSFCITGIKKYIFFSFRLACTKHDHVFREHLRSPGLTVNDNFQLYNLKWHKCVWCRDFYVANFVHT